MFQYQPGWNVDHKRALRERCIFKSREEWLHAAARIMASWIDEAAEKVNFPERFPGNVRYGVGFPTHSSGSKVLGAAWSRECSKDKAAETFISPVCSSSQFVAGVLLHEMCHHTLGIPEGHGKRWSELVKALGLTGKLDGMVRWSAAQAVPGDEVNAKIDTMLETLGKYPHGEMVFETYTTPSGRTKRVPKGMKPKVVGGGLLKVECSNDNLADGESCNFHFRCTAPHLPHALNMNCGNCGSTMQEG